MTTDQRSWWTIDITNYGTFTVYTTKHEADDQCRTKAAWEGGRGRMRAAKPEEIEGAKERIRWRHAHGYPVEDYETEALRS
jgi:hypothetical protein